MQATAWKVSPTGEVERCAPDQEIAVVRSSMMNNDHLEFVCCLTSLSFEGSDEGRTVRGNLMVSDYDYCWESGACFVLTAGELVPSKGLVRAAVEANASAVFYKRSLIRRFLDWIN